MALPASRPVESATESPAHRDFEDSQHTVLRVAPGALVAFIGAAFLVVTLTGDRSTAFVGLVLASSLLLVLIVGYLAFAGGQSRRGQTFLDEFDGAEQADPAPDDFDLDDFEDGPRLSLPTAPSSDPASSPVRAFVEKLVAVPPPPRSPTTPASRRAYVAALQWEGKQLIGLARATGLNTEPYRLHLLDARRAASQGDIDVSLTSLRLANELLRRSVESAFLKQRKRAAGPTRHGAS